MSSVCVAALFTAERLANGQNNSATEPLATIIFRVIDDNGVAVYDSHVEQFLDRQGHEMASHFHDLRGVQIPYGMYRYVLKRERIPTASLVASVQIDMPEHMVVVTANSEFLY